MRRTAIILAAVLLVFSSGLLLAGVAAEDERIDQLIEFRAPVYLEHGDESDYTVMYSEFDVDDGGFEKIDVTDEAEVTSGDTDLLEVDQSEHRLIATDDNESNGIVELRIEYENGVQYYDISVGELSLENLENLPASYWIPAILTDFSLMWVAGSILIGSLLARVTNGWVGLAGIEMGLVLGWFGGIISLGLVLAGLFTVIFIALVTSRNTQIVTGHFPTR